jgi:phage-related holin
VLSIESEPMLSNMDHIPAHHRPSLSHHLISVYIIERPTFLKVSFVCPELQIVLMSTLCLMANPFNTKLYKSDANHSFSYKKVFFGISRKVSFSIHQLIDQNYDVLHFI